MELSAEAEFDLLEFLWQPAMLAAEHCGTAQGWNSSADNALDTIYPRSLAVIIAPSVTLYPTAMGSYSSMASSSGVTGLVPTDLMNADTESVGGPCVCSCDSVSSSSAVSSTTRPPTVGMMEKTS